MKKIILLFVLVASSFQLFAQDGYIGEIRLFAGNFEPVNWSFCDGRTLQINANAALYSILGTTYGGNGTTTFCLPDLRSRIPIQPGTGTGLSTYTLGQTGGTETNTLTTAQLPAHTHTITVTQQVKADEGNSDDPTGRYPATAGKNSFTNAPAATSAALTATASVSGNPTPTAVNNRQPYLGMNYIICVIGVYPSRN